MKTLYLAEEIALLQLSETNPTEIIAILQSHHPSVSYERLAALVTDSIERDRARQKETWRP
jgi:hypothetical protein